MLEAPLLADDVKLALLHFFDGLPIKLYVHFSDVLVPRLVALCQAIFKATTLPESRYKAIIVLIPKPRKDPHLPESYRPISLLQTDVKILAKILALDLKKVILSLINPDQTGFMPTKNTAFNTRRLFMNFQASHHQIGSRVIVSLTHLRPLIWLGGSTYGSVFAALGLTPTLSNGSLSSTTLCRPG